MKSKLIKLLPLSVVIASSFALAMCSKPAEQAPAAQEPAAQAQGATTSTLGYPLVPQQLIYQLDKVRNESAENILNMVKTNYPMVIAEVAGLQNRSPEYNQLDAFVTEFLKDMATDEVGFSIGLVLANDLSSEAVFFNDAQNGYGYPVIPAENKDGLYQSYKTQLVDNFKKQIVERFELYKSEKWQSVNITNYDKVGVATVVEKIQGLVDQFFTLVDNTTKNDLVCHLQDTEIQKAQCFADYLSLVARLPEALAVVHYLDVKGIDYKDYVSDNFKENIIGRQISFYNDYIKFQQIPEFEAK